MRKLFSIILSFTLISAPVTGIAQAKDPEEMPSINAEMGELEQLKDPKNPRFRQIFTISNSIIGSTMMIKCKLSFAQASIPLFTAGSLVQLVGEMRALKEQKVIKKLIEDPNNKCGVGGNNTDQKECLNLHTEVETAKLHYIQKRAKSTSIARSLYVIAASAAAVELFVSSVKSSQGFCIPNEAVNLPSLNFIINLIKEVIPGPGVILTGVITKVTGLMEKVITKLNNLAFARLALFSILAIITQLILKDLKEEEKITEAQIAKLNAIASSMPAVEKPTFALPGAKELYKPTTASETLDVAKNRICVGVDSIPSENCKETFKLTNISIGDDFIDPRMNDALKAATEFSNSFFNGGEAADLDAVEKLGAAALDASKVKDKVLKDLNDNLIAKGKPPLDLDKEIRKQTKDIINGLNKFDSDFKDLESSSSGLASLGGQSSVSQSDKKGENTIGTASSNNVVGALPSGLGPEKNPDGETDFNLGAYESDGPISDQEGSSPSRSLASDKKDPTDEIWRDPSDSLFRQLSQRYLQSYPKIFVERPRSK